MSTSGDGSASRIRITVAAGSGSAGMRRIVYHRRVTGPPLLREIHAAEEVRERVDRLAAEVAREWAAEQPLLLTVAQGARRFSERLRAGLERRGVRPRVDVVRARRTRRGTELGEVRLDPFDASRLAGQDVLVIDDIVDEGRTLEAVLRLVAAAHPRSVRVAVLVDKRARRRVELQLDWVGFVLGDGWVVGMGMDLDGAYRELDALAIVEEKETSA
jgi:hypoxanthine phosphoribosyltransferase